MKVKNFKKNIRVILYPNIYSLLQSFLIDCNYYFIARIKRIQIDTIHLLRFNDEILKIPSPGNLGIFTDDTFKSVTLLNLNGLISNRWSSCIIKQQNHGDHSQHNNAFHASSFSINHNAHFKHSFFYIRALFIPI